MGKTIRFKGPHQCHYCKRRIRLMHEPGKLDLQATKDHWHPKGKDCFAVWACWKCNNMKSDLPIEIWLCFIFEHTEWWMMKTGAAVKWARDNRHIP